MLYLYSLYNVKKKKEKKSKKESPAFNKYGHHKQPLMKLNVITISDKGKYKTSTLFNKVISCFL